MACAPSSTFASYVLILKKGSDESFIRRKQAELDVLLLQVAHEIGHLTFSVSLTATINTNSTCSWVWL
jgi:hypothetical protein